MKVLALETSARACSAAVTEDGRVVCSAFQCTGLTHSRTLMPMVEDMLKNAGLSLTDCGAVAVAAAKGLAFGAGLPAVGVSTLEAMARNIAFADGVIVCAMDARRQQVYNALFRAEGGVLTRLTPDRPIGLEELAGELAGLEGPKTAVGDGGALCCGYLTGHGVPCALAPAHLLQQNAVSVALAAEEILRAGGGGDAQALTPVYLRAASAQTLKERMEKTR